MEECACICSGAQPFRRRWRATLSRRLQRRQRSQDQCELVEEPGTYYVGADASGASSGGPGDPDGDDPNAGGDDLDDPFDDHED